MQLFTSFPSSPPHMLRHMLIPLSISCSATTCLNEQVTNDLVPPSNFLTSYQPYLAQVNKNSHSIRHTTCVGMPSQISPTHVFHSFSRL